MYIYLGPYRDLIQGLMLVMLWAGTRSPTLPAGREGDRDMPVAIVYWMELYGDMLEDPPNRLCLHVISSTTMSY